MSKLEKKFGKYAVKNLSLVLILCYGLGELISRVNPTFLSYLALNPYEILHGQIWRLVTWIISPPQTGNIFITFIMLLFYYSIGTTLEKTWGAYRYNVYILLGILLTVVGSFIAMGAAYLWQGELLTLLTAQEQLGEYFAYASLMISTYYVSMSIFLAYAATFPQAQVLLMFIIPVKVKWLGILYGVMLAMDLVMPSASSPLPGLLLFRQTQIVASLLNFGIFWFLSKNRMHLSPKQVVRRQQFRQEIKRNPKILKHKCAICGRTEEDDPTLEFRFCSKCNGNYEYCQAHLFSHLHKE
ncbi:MAG: hypothetical protein LBM69_07270 [Lachnospiraceae bacterium]|jgi:hypothetical protein|nr:hypothetical protein [Lachnospiraceae bacterium]